ncbi:MAG: polymer-forming cytoskeletal protein [Moraxella sp.]|nr:polymer-forming cytoskeletal protein [Moraxella sp.]
MNPYFYPAKILQYNPSERTAMIDIQGLTDGMDGGIEAYLAYPIGDDDKDTERELVAGADVWVFFEQGDMYAPVIAFYRRHGVGAIVDTRRIRQKNIELLARSHIKLSATDTIHAATGTFTIDGNVVINGDITHNGNSNQTGDATINGNSKVQGNISSSGNIQSAGNVKGATVTAGSLDMGSRRHGGVESGRGISGTLI